MQKLLGTVFFLPTLFLVGLGFAVAIRRLLGVRIGLVRTVLAAALALTVSGPLLTAMVRRPEAIDTGSGILLTVLAACCASLVAMIVLVIGEVLVPDGSLPGPVELWRGWRSRMVRARRYSQIVRIAARHGLGRFLRGYRHSGLESPTSRRHLARSVRLALDEGGVTFVKLGQQLSTRRDLLPPEFVTELTQLQDNAAPIAWPQVEEVLVAEFGRPVGEVFAEFDHTPLAAASVAQVHSARLPDGRPVVVKVQRPGIERTVERDLDILLRLARTLESRTDWGRSLGVADLAGGFAEALREELDFTVERDNLQAMAAALADGPAREVRVPVPHAGLATERVLVMERLHGTPLGAAEEALAALGTERRRQVANALLETVFDQVLVRGMFHVDLHPGNVLVAADGSLGMLDLGSVGRLDGTTRLAVGRLLAALGRADSMAACDALLELVDRPDEIDERTLERALGVLIVRYASPGANAGAAAFAELFRLVTAHRLGIPPQVAAIFRTFATLEGTLTVVDPEFDLVAGAREAGRAQLAESVEPVRLRQSLEDELVTLLPMLRRLPRRVDRIADAVEHGRFTVNVRLFADARDRRVVTDLVHQALLAFVGAAAGVLAVMLLGTDGGPQVTETFGLFGLLAYALLIVAVVLVLRVLVVVFRRDPA